MFDIVTLAKTANSVYTFATGDAFKGALDAMAVVETKAAQDAFSKVDYSAQPREALNRALTHLETAHVALRNSWSSTISGFVRRYKSEAQALRDARVCCLIATIHYALGDGKGAIADALKNAEEAMAFEQSGGLESLVHILNPINYMDMAAEDSKISYAKLRIPGSEFEEFRGILMKG